MISENFSFEIAQEMWEKGISICLVKIPWPGGDEALLRAVVSQLMGLVKSSGNLEIKYCWKMEKGNPAQLWVISCCSLGYFAVGQAVSNATLNLKYTENTKNQQIMGLFKRKQVVVYHVYATFITPSGGYDTGCKTFASHREARKAAEIINRHENCVGVVCYDGDIKIDGNQAKVVFRLGPPKP